MVNVTTGFNNLGRQEDDIKVSFVGSESDGAGNIFVDGKYTKCTFKNKTKNGYSFLYVNVISDFYDYMKKGASFIVDNEGNSTGEFDGKSFSSLEGKFTELKQVTPVTEYNVITQYIDNA